MYYLPAITSIVAVSSVFLTFYNPTGLFNSVLATIGLAPIPWLTDPFWARVSIIIISVWLNVGYYTVLFFSRLAKIYQLKSMKVRTLMEQTACKSF